MLASVPWQRNQRVSRAVIVHQIECVGLGGLDKLECGVSLPFCRICE